MSTSATRPLVILIVWSAIEATIFAFALRPTMSELVSNLAGFTVNFGRAGAPALLAVLNCPSGTNR
jgi:hypothetical protein